ncbi:YadA-like family protein, partial [Cloacibacillus sp.]
LGDGTTPVKLKNVADAELSETSTEAVTGKQLYAASQNIDAVSGDLNQKISDISVNAEFAVKYDDTAKTAITFGDGTNPVRLKNVADGVSDTDAVNYRQLRATNQSIEKLGSKVNSIGSNLAERMGGTYDPNTGEFTITYPSGPTPSVNPAANSAINSAGKTANAEIPGGDPTLNETLQKMWDSMQTVGVTAGDNISVEGGKVSVVKNPEFESVKVGAVDITREGIDMGGKNITGLADGGIYNGSSDAVNGGQLWNAYNRIEELDNDIRVAGAHAAALSAMHPIAYNPYEPTTISAGYGYYRSEQSFAVGVFHYIRENVLVNAGMAFNSDGDTMGRAGVSFALGKSGRKQPSMIKDVSEMQKQMAAMKEMLMQLKEENERNKEENERNKEENRKNRETIKELKEALKEKK